MGKHLVRTYVPPGSKALAVSAELESRPARTAAPSGPKGLDASGADPSMI